MHGFLFPFSRNIKRIVLFTVTKTVVRENGDKEITLIPPTAALQIVGRAGRYGTEFEHGHVTTFLKRDLPTLNNILNTPVESIQVSHHNHLSFTGFSIFKNCSAGDRILE